MATKYAHLPDIDDAPEIYESADIDESVRQINETSDLGSDDEDGKVTGINRRPLQPDEARNTFDKTRINANGTDFSDQLAAKKHSYSISSRSKKASRAREQQDASETDSDLDEQETLARRIARLNREVEEVRALVQQQQQQQQEGSSAAQDVVADEKNDDEPRTSLDRITKALSTIQHSQRQAVSAHSLLVAQLSSPPTRVGKTLETVSDSFKQSVSTQGADQLVDIAAFDERLVQLEAALGIDKLDMSQHVNTSLLPILPNLSLLDQQISLLASAQDLPHLEEKLDRLRSASSKTARTSDGGREDRGDEEDTAPPDDELMQLRSLYALVPSFSTLTPTVPALLTRLRSLKHLHGTAAQAGDLLDEIERKQTETDNDLAAWRSALEKVEQAVGQAEQGLKSNADQIETWVSELEERIRQADVTT